MAHMLRHLAVLAAADGAGGSGGTGAQPEGHAAGKTDGETDEAAGQNNTGAGEGEGEGETEAGVDAGADGDYAAALNAIEAEWTAQGKAFAQASGTGSEDGQGSSTTEIEAFKNEIASLRAQVNTLLGRAAPARRGEEKTGHDDDGEDGVELDPSDPRAFERGLQTYVGRSIRAALRDTVGQLREEFRADQTQNFAALGDFTIGQQIASLQPRYPHANTAEVNAAIGEYCQRTRRLPTSVQVEGFMRSSHEPISRAIHDEVGKVLKAMRERVKPQMRITAGRGGSPPALKFERKKGEGSADTARRALDALTKQRRISGDF